MIMAKEIIPVKTVEGTIQAPPSKAHTLRAIIIASLAKGKSVIKNGLIAEDQEYAIKAMKQLGAQINVDRDKNVIEVIGVEGKPIAPKETIFIGNSGLTARFLVSAAGLAEGEQYITIDGTERMRTGRTMQDLLDALAPLGVKAVSLNNNGCPPIRIKTNSFLGGITTLAGDKSSQYFSSILIASPYAAQDVEIQTIGHLSSKPYIDVTIQSMKEFGVETENNNYESFFVRAGQKYVGKEMLIEGDYSNAAYFFSAAAIMKGRVTVTNLEKESKQGDKFFVLALKKMGCKIKWNKNSITLDATGVELKGLGETDMNDYPDIVMPLAVVASFAEGETKITNIEHLRIKESDRITVTADSLKQLGVEADAGKDYLLIKGHSGKGMHGAGIDSSNDHRIAMSFTIAGLKIPGVKIINERAVDKSYPNFYEELEKIVKR
jgi:3-phosphoshikimate 1-carboxyvinyltransferase